jgi:pimeloyl-ACP methyl ester carboxylesterase
MKVMSVSSPTMRGHCSSKIKCDPMTSLKVHAFTRVSTASRHHHHRRCHVVLNAAASSPERAVIILPGLGNNAADYTNLAAQLTEQNLHVEIAPVARIDWARNAAGLLDTAYWTGALKPRPTVDWYLDRITTAISAAKTQHPDLPLTLLAHSAGGWLGRLYMLEFGTSSLNINRFVSLGSPHLAPPPGVVDQTRGILTWISENSPGCYHDDVEYVTIAGKYIKGAAFSGPGGWQRRVVGAGYQQVCGDAGVWGDGVVPVPAAHLEGALQLTLEGVYHSPLGAEDGSVDEKNGENNEVSATIAEMKQESVDHNKIKNNGGGGDSGGVSTNTDLSTQQQQQKQKHRTLDGTSYDSDDYNVSIESVEHAAAEAWPGPRLWYGSTIILEQWAGLLKSSAVVPDGAVAPAVVRKR